MLYQKEQYSIYLFKTKGRPNEYIIRNMNKDFEDGHTHIKSYKVAKRLISLAVLEKIDLSLKPYFILSLMRIIDSKEYFKKLQELKEIKKQKGKKLSYRNRKY
jgi:cell division protein FtsB